MDQRVRYITLQPNKERERKRELVKPYNRRDSLRGRTKVLTRQSNAEAAAGCRQVQQQYKGKSNKKEKIKTDKQNHMWVEGPLATAAEQLCRTTLTPAARVITGICPCQHWHHGGMECKPRV
jgi:hypothetical protein